MLHYRVYGMHLASFIEFPQLLQEKNESEQADIVIEPGKLDKTLQERAINKKWEFGDEYSWFVNKTAWYEITNGNLIRYQLKTEGNEQYLPNFLLGLAMSMLFMQRKMLTIHCSVVCDSEGAILIAGESGIGKSTLTTELLREGYALVADDMVVVNRSDDQVVMAYPAFPYQKLCRDAVVKAGYDLDSLLYIDEEKDKFLVPYLKQFSLAPIPVREMVVLAGYDGTTVQSKTIEGFDKVKIVYQNLFLRKLLARDNVDPRIFNMCLETASGIRTKLVLRPKEGNTLVQVKEAVLS